MHKNRFEEIRDKMEHFEDVDHAECYEMINELLDAISELIGW